MVTLEKDDLLKRWGPILEGITDQHTALTTAKLLDNQAKAFMAEKMNEEALGTGTTTVGRLGTFQKWAFPMIRRIFPELIFNKIGATQAMDGPVSQVFYMGNSRVYGSNVQTMYSMFQITPFNRVAGRIGSTSGAGTAGWTTIGGTSALQYGNNYGNVNGAGFDLSNVLQPTKGSVSTTIGGGIAGWPVTGSFGTGNTILGWSVSAGEQLRTSGIPEVTLHIQKQTVQARTRKMRALWTLEAAQDLKAYHNLDMENELTELLTKEIQLEIDRELIEDIRMIAYGLNTLGTTSYGGWYLRSLFNGNADNFPEIGGIGPDGNTFSPASFTYENPTTPAAETEPNTSGSNVYVMDLAQFYTTGAAYAPQHLGHVYSNVLALINFASNDIYRTTFRGPGSVLITSPIMASMLESAAKLEGGLALTDKPTNTADSNSVKYVGKFAGKYDLIIDPMLPEDEIIVGYKGSSNMDAGLVYCPYIPLMSSNVIIDPATYNPQVSLMTRYGKATFTNTATSLGNSADYYGRINVANLTFM